MKMNMKTKKHCSRPGNLRLLLMSLLIILAFIAFPTPVSGQSKASDEPYFAVDEMPVFPGGDVALLKFIANNMQYPVNARENNIEGKVIIRFCVTSDGSINQITVLKSVDSELDNEAIRVVKKLPIFKPGKKAGVPVPVWYMVPITFKMAKN